MVGRKLLLCTAYKAGGLLKSLSSFIVLSANLNFGIETGLRDGWLSAKVAESQQAYQIEQNLPPFGWFLMLIPHPVYSTRNFPWRVGAR